MIMPAYTSYYVDVECQYVSDTGEDIRLEHA